eukprot:4785390-Heterocapsa_arctica.AAC.1
MVGGFDEHMERMKEFIVKCPQDINLISRDQFGLLVKVNRHSAPGPDGISYATWACADEGGIDL